MAVYTQISYREFYKIPLWFFNHNPPAVITVKGN